MKTLAILAIFVGVVNIAFGNVLIGVMCMGNAIIWLSWAD